MKMESRSERIGSAAAQADVLDFSILDTQQKEQKVRLLSIFCLFWGLDGGGELMIMLCCIAYWTHINSSLLKQLYTLRWTCDFAVD